MDEVTRVHRQALTSAGDQLDRASLEGERVLVEAAVLTWSATVYSVHARYWSTHREAVEHFRRAGHPGACLAAALVHVRSSVAYDWATSVEPRDSWDDRWRDSWFTWHWRPSAGNAHATAAFYRTHLADRLIEHGIGEVITFLTETLPRAAASNRSDPESETWT
jgi:hypothetical protein